jgi:hypothetical protein
LDASIVQLISAPAGKLSVTLSPVAVPALLLLRVTVKAICEPALTLESSALSLIDVAAHRTVSEAIASPETALSAVKLAVLLYVPQLPPVVLVTTCAWVVVIPANVVGV